MNDRVFSVVYMFMITLFFTSLVTAVRIINEEKIQTNEKVKLQRVILNALDIPAPSDISDDELVQLFQKRVKKEVIADRTIYSMHDPEKQKPVRYAAIISGSGVWGPISAIVATDDNVEKLLYIDFFKHQETPGLGARITEKSFTDQFSGLALSSGSERNDFISITPPAPGKSPQEIDAITGATQTSRAVESFLNKEIAFIKGMKEKIKDI